MCLGEFLGPVQGRSSPEEGGHTCTCELSWCSLPSRDLVGMVECSAVLPMPQGEANGLGLQQEGQGGR